MKKKDRKKWNIPEGMTWLDYCEVNGLSYATGEPYVDRNGPSKVYVLHIKGTRYFKVGQSARPKIRAEMFAAWTPFPIQVAIVIDCPSGYLARTAEASLHRILKNKMIRRCGRSEWFELSKADTAYLRRSVIPRVESFMKSREGSVSDLMEFMAGSGVKPIGERVEARVEYKLYQSGIAKRKARRS